MPIISKDPTFISRLKTFVPAFTATLDSNTAISFMQMSIDAQLVFLAFQLWQHDKLEEGVEIDIPLDVIAKKANSRFGISNVSFEKQLSFLLAISGRSAIITSQSVRFAPRWLADSIILFFEQTQEKEKSVTLDPYEKTVQRIIAKRLKGKMEVKTPAGMIDVLTATHVIEVKNYCGWKSAIGQVLAYSASYPERRKAIYLYGKTPSNLSVIAQVCESLDIDLLGDDFNEKY